MSKPSSCRKRSGREQRTTGFFARTPGRYRQRLWQCARRVSVAVPFPAVEGPGALPARQSPRPSPRLLFARHPARSGSRSVTPSASSSEAGQQGVVAGHVLPVREMKAAIGVLQRVNVVRLDLCILGDWDNPVVVNVGAFNAPAMTGTKSSILMLLGPKRGRIT